MLANHIIIGISEDGQHVVVQPVHPLLTAPAPHQIPLADLERRGYDGAVRMLGTGLLDLLALVHADALAPYPALKAPPDDLLRAFLDEIGPMPGGPMPGSV